MKWKYSILALELPPPRYKHNKNLETILLTIVTETSTEENKIKIVYSQLLFVTRVRVSAPILKHLYSQVQHTQSETFKCTRLQNWFWLSDENDNVALAKTAKLRGMKRDNDLKLKIRHILWFQKVIRFFFCALIVCCVKQFFNSSCGKYTQREKKSNEEKLYALCIICIKYG